MSAEIIPLNCVTRLDVPVARVLEGAKEQLADGEVIVLGWDKDGELYFAANKADGGSCLWLMEKAKQALLEAELE